MAEVALVSVLRQLVSLLIQEQDRLGGLKRELQFINDELDSMRAFLRKAESKVDVMETDHQLKQWVKQVREVAYDTEDVIDEFQLVFGRRRHSGLHGRLQNIYTHVMTLRARYRISGKLISIKCRVQDISARHQRYKLDYGSNGIPSCSSIADDEDNPIHHIRHRALLLEEVDLVGIEAPKKELLSQILDVENSRLKVVSIVGMGGSGKTTLVKRVYEDADVKKQFHCHAWITISQTFIYKSILKDLIQQLHDELKILVPQEVESKNVDGLEIFLKDFLREKRYVIIFDDIWSIDAWEPLIYALPDSNCGSRVMLTTRIADIAKASCHQHGGYVYRMKALPNNESWTLFCNKTFEDKSCPLHLLDISHSILMKCGGLPLAIASIGGILLRKDTNRLDEWEKVLRNLGGEFEGTGKLDRVKKILLLSYDDLPYYLKGCLLYTCLYPEDYKINRKDLINLWIAEGFVQDREGISREEIAEGYINELVNRTLLQVERRTIDGSIECCRIHDLIREITIPKVEEQDIMAIVKRGYTKGSDDARRLVIHESTSDIAPENMQSKRLRSLLMFRYVDHNSTSSLLELLCRSSKFLKVLELSGSPLKSIPKEVFKLFNLKHLDLSSSEVKFVPKSIKKLQNLQFLDLGETEVTELPTEIVQLQKLRVLFAFKSGDYASNYEVRGFKAPNEIGRLFSLEYLYCIEADNEKVVIEIGKMNRLRGLGITKLRKEDGKHMCCSLEKLTNLRHLQVQSMNGDEILDLQHPMSAVPQFLKILNLSGRLEKVPQWVSSLQGLTELCLYWSGLGEDELELLQTMPNLLELGLFQAYEGEKLGFKVRRFPKLKNLYLIQLKRLRHVIIEEGAMPHLEHLEMIGCELVEELPQGIQNLSQMKTINLVNMPKKLIAELRNRDKENENYRKISHIPEIYISDLINGEWHESFL